MRYAINIYDWQDILTEADFRPEKLLLSGLLPSREEAEIVRCEGQGKPDGDGLLVPETVSDEQWRAIVELLRDKFDNHRNLRRLYQSKTGKGGWKRV